MSSADSRISAAVTSGNARTVTRSAAGEERNPVGAAEDDGLRGGSAP